MTKEQIEQKSIELYPDLEGWGIHNDIANRQAYIKGFTDAQPQWIDVKDRLPEQKTKVLAYMPKWNKVDVFYFSGELFHIIIGVYSTEGVTHWQALPEPPVPHKPQIQDNITPESKSQH